MPVTTIISIGLVLGILSPPCIADSSPNRTGGKSGDYVVLLHGMGQTSFSMKRLELFLSLQNYRVINLSYNSGRYSVEELAEIFLGNLLRDHITDSNARVSFVTHSLGGIILRQYLSNHGLKNLGRVVMIAPPNHGSEIIDRLKSCWLRPLMGPSGRELGTEGESVPSRLGPVNFDCGIIAGDRSANPFLSQMLPGPNDGKVTIESTKVDGMKDFLVLHSTHTWISWRKQTLRQVDCFLKTGSFNHCQNGNCPGGSGLF